MKCATCGFEIDEKQYTVCPFCGNELVSTGEPEQIMNSCDEFASGKHEKLKTELEECNLFVVSEDNIEIEDDAIDSSNELNSQSDNAYSIDFSLATIIPKESISGIFQKAIALAHFGSLDDFVAFILESGFKPIFELVKPHHVMGILGFIATQRFIHSELGSVIPIIFRRSELGRIHESNMRMPSKVLITLGMTNRFVSSLEKIGLKSSCDCTSIDCYELLDLLTKENDTSLIKFFDVISLLSNNSVSLLQNFVESTPQHYIDITRRRSNGESLESIALSYGLTRERIRQIQVKFGNYLLPFRDWVINELGLTKEYFFEQDVLDILRQYSDTTVELENLFLFTFKIDPRFEYLDFAACFYKAGKTKHYHEEQIDQCISKIIGDSFAFLPDILEMVENESRKLHYDFIGYEELYNYLLKYGYNINNKYVCKHTAVLVDMCKLELIKHFPNGIKTTSYDKQTDSNDLEMLRKYIYDDFNYIVTANDRAFSCTIQRAGTFLSGKGRWNIPENIVVDFELLETIVRYIDNTLVDTLHYDSIYSEFSGALMLRTSIDCSECLHGVLRYYYPDRYDYRRDYLVHDSSPMMDTSLTFYDRMDEYMKAQNRIVSLSEIQSALGRFSIYSITQYACNSKQYCHMGNNDYIHVDCLKFDWEKMEKFIQQLLDFISQQKNYCSTMQAYRLAEESISDILKENELSDEFRFASFLEYVGKDYLDIRKPHILKKGVLGEDISYDAVLQFLMRDQNIISRKKTMQWGHDIGLKAMPMDYTFSRICFDMIQIDNDRYLNPNCCDVFSCYVDDVFEYIKTHMENGYFSLFLEHSYSELPYTGYKWNNYIIRSILNNYDSEFKIIESETNSRSYVKSVVVFKDFQCESYPDFVATYCLSNDKKRMTEDEFLIFLQLNGLATNKIPYDLRESHRFKFKNNMVDVTETQI